MEDWESLVEADEPPPPPPPAPEESSGKNKKKKRKREEEQLQEVPGWDRQLGMLRTLTQLDETAMDGASAGSDASCSAIPAQSIVQEERKKKRKHLKHKRASEQDAGSLRALEQLSVGSMKKKKQQKKTKKKRGAALLNVTEH